MYDIFGCDIGNGFAFVSLIPGPDSDAQPMLPVSRDLNPNEGMPTAAYVTPPGADPILVYDADRGTAARSIRRDPAHGVRAVKTHLRRASLEMDGLDSPLSPYAVYGAAARDLVRLGNLQRAADGLPPIYRLVLTYPAAFSNYSDELEILNRMQAAVEAVRLDNHPLQVVGRLPEPAAVAIDYLYYMQHQLPEGQRLKDDQFTVLVFDLGHGTFDVAVVTARSKGEPYQVWASDGLPDVGGKDFDARLMDELLEMMQQEGYQLRDAQEREELLREAVAAKHELSRDEEAVVRHQNRRNGSYMELTITRARFEEITRDLLLQAVEKTQQMLQDQLARGRTVDSIVLSGGASQMPMVRRALEAYIQPAVPVQPPFRPSRAVSFGAARYGLGLSVQKSEGRKKEKDPTPAPPNPVAQLYTRHSYGVLVETADVMEGKVQILLPAETPLPATATLEEYWTGRGRMDCRVYRPRARTQVSVLEPDKCVNLRWLHFDLPPDTYRLTLTVDPNYNIIARLEGRNGTVHTASTAEET